MMKHSHAQLGFVRPTFAFRSNSKLKAKQRSSLQMFPLPKKTFHCGPNVLLFHFLDCTETLHSKQSKYMHFKYFQCQKYNFSLCTNTSAALLSISEHHKHSGSIVICSCFTALWLYIFAVWGHPCSANTWYLHSEL